MWRLLRHSQWCRPEPLPEAQNLEGLTGYRKVNLNALCERIQSGSHTPHPVRGTSLPVICGTAAARNVAAGGRRSKARPRRLRPVLIT